MWFLFGLITLISFCSYKAYVKIHASWEGKTGTTQGINYRYDADSSLKGEVKAFKIAIDATEGHDFILKRERSVDRLFKHIGVSREYEIGNSEFDDLIYVISDDKLLHQQLSSSPDLVNAIIRLFSYREGMRNKVTELQCNSGRLWATFSVIEGYQEHQAPFLAPKLVPHLSRIAEHLKAADYRGSVRGKDPFLIKAAIILAISSGLFLNGLTHMFRVHFSYFPINLDKHLLMTDTIIASITIITLLLFVAIRSLGRSARTHIVLIEILITGCIGDGLTTYTQLHEFNMARDRSETQEFITTLVSKSYSGRKNTHYYFYIENWTTEPHISRRKIEVSRELYRSASRGSKLLIKQNSGYLDYRWVSSIAVVE